jgi:type I restriction enzyme S subunit
MSFDSNFPLVTLKEVAKFINGDRSTNYPKGADYIPDGIPFISAADLSDEGVDQHKVKRITATAYERLRSGKIQHKDILFCLRGSIGKMAFVKPNEIGAIASSLVIVRANSQIDSRYLNFLLCSQAGQQAAMSLNNGSAQPNLSVNQLQQIRVPLPNLREQLEIAAMLGSLDDRITLLRETNATLEAIVQALFKSWFVDFDPVRAKMEGRDPEGMDEATAALFPGGFEESTLGLVPRGWETAVLAELTTKIGSGATPRGGKDVYLDDGVALIRSQNVYDSEFVWSGLARISNDAADQLKSVEVKPTDVLLNITGASILRTCVVIPDVLPARVNQHVAIIRANENIPSRYIHLHLLQRKTKEFLLGLNAGGSREAVTKVHIESVPIIRPSDAVLAAFKEITNSIYLRNEVFSRQERTLATLRDTLLPRLISGQLRLSEAQAVAEEALA